ncbi:aminodeoxychorismate/anthranilate synthase component II [Idiomarina sp. OT37-5b]|jgi:anthranilate synthase/aminodeoxychorismate synthase-like glutamine amidotransferase|uniref:anthranilate synthase component II n=1 Tax=Idiomarina sp. OT37-5b TaxID=2100422 RepID=UPI000CF9F5C2|nr:aminodeoxychorismate/anthranilate synthase component II [Idiomarina sp. OT37-5b]AVJ56958.1 aminodeoxychorismate/anthranilate synthase component II [Idiomarina sp. OT37-5b]
MLVLIDNYDSFSHNLARYFRELGEQVVVYRNDQVTVSQLQNLAMTALVISPGPCTPNDSGVSLAAIEAFAGKLPILGVCLGHQALAQVFGAEVVRAKRVMHGKTSRVTHTSKGLFNNLPAPLTVTRYHSLVVEPSSLPSCFSVDAWVDSMQFGQEIMAIRHTELPLYGVQFHPESVMTEAGHQLLQNFLETRN